MKNENVNFPLPLTEHNGAFVSYKTNRWWFTKKWAGILD
jgi:hypothetical protein